MPSKIEWTNEVWNPVVGCTRASAGCDHCYAVTMSHRLENMGQDKYRGLTVLNAKGDRHFNGVVRCVEKDLTIPLRWKKPRKVFVNSMSDLFHRSIPFDYIDKCFAVMALSPQHTFQVLTKRPERMAEYFAERSRCSSAEGGWIETKDRIIGACRLVAETSSDAAVLLKTLDGSYAPWPFPNVWLGTSVEDQSAADARIPTLLRCPAAVRFLSCEPLLGSVDLHLDQWKKCEKCKSVGIDGLRCPACGEVAFATSEGPDWVICGGESGSQARPMHPAWAQSLRDQCTTAGVKYFFKQWGAWVTEDQAPEDIVLPGESVLAWATQDKHGDWGGDETAVFKVGKHDAGRILDGRTWDEYPEAAHV